MRNNESVAEKIKKRYWPRVDAQGKLIAPMKCRCEDKERHRNCLEGVYPDDAPETYDPNVVYVGPLIDGLVRLNVFIGRTPGAARQVAKSFFYDSGDTGRGKGPENFSLVFERAIALGKKAWPYDETRYGPEVELRSISGRPGDSVEPGDIRNSAEVESGGDGDIWARNVVVRDFEPVLLVDKLCGLHILRRGDRFVKTYVARRGGERKKVVETFVLRPLAEGSSYIRPTVRTERVIA